MAKNKLKTGESKMKDGFRYRKMIDGKRKVIYARTLPELRKKEKELLSAENFEDFTTKIPTLREEVRKSLDLKRNASFNTIQSYNYWFDVLKNDPIMDQPVNQIKTSDVKEWLLQIYDSGKAYSTLNGYFTGLIRPAFDLAVEDGLIVKSPTNFKLSSLIRDRSKTTKRALTEEEIELLLDYMTNGPKAAQNLKPIFVLLLETGLRISEFCGLTKNDIDLENGLIYIRRQLIRRHKIVHIYDLKSESGNRILPLSETATSIFQELMSQPLPDFEVDGVSGFLFFNRSGEPTDSTQLRSRYYLMLKTIDQQYGTNLGETTFHTIRHTYCTRLIQQGVNVKVVQYLMGHKTATTTLEIYSHVDMNFVKKECSKALSLKHI